MANFQPDGLTVVSIRAADLHATTHFYRDVIGLRLLPHHGTRPTLALGHGAHLVIVQGANVPAPPLPEQGSASDRFPVLAFTVADLEAAIAHLQAHQVELPWGIESSDQARWVMFHDPAGNLLEFAQFHNS